MADHGAPISYLVLEPGVDVYDAEGEHVGTVEHVLADEDSDVFDGLVIDVRRGPGGLRFADSEQVGGLFERAVLLTVSADELHDPEPNPAVLDAEPGDEPPTGLSARLRRAWDYISGNY